MLLHLGRGNLHYKCKLSTVPCGKASSSFLTTPRSAEEAAARLPDLLCPPQQGPAAGPRDTAQQPPPTLLSLGDPCPARLTRQPPHSASATASQSSGAQPQEAANRISSSSGRHDAAPNRKAPCWETRGYPSDSRRQTPLPWKRGRPAGAAARLSGTNTRRPDIVQ